VQHPQRPDRSQCREAIEDIGESQRYRAVAVISERIEICSRLNSPFRERRLVRFQTGRCAFKELDAATSLRSWSRRGGATKFPTSPVLEPVCLGKSNAAY
jgi:hypothetical protein